MMKKLITILIGLLFAITLSAQNTFKYVIKADGGITVPVSSITIGAVTVTATGTELNVLHNIPAGLTSTELGYVDGVTSSIQGQLDALKDSIALLRSLIASVAAESYPIYYISNDGSDDSTGLTPITAWKTIAKVMASNPAPDSKILFKRGDEWREQLTIPTSGTADQRIVYGAYGTGAKPIINGADVVTGWGDSYNNIDSDIWGTVSPNVTTTRATVVIDDSLYTQVATLAEVISPRTYWIKTASTPDSLYVWSKTDPDSRVAEVSKRNYGIFSNKLYISISYLDVRNCGTHGIVFYGSNSNVDGYTVIDSCNVYRNRMNGINLADGWSHSTIQNCTATYNGNNFMIWGSQIGAAGSGGAGSNYNIITHCYSGYSVHDWIMTGSHADGTGFQIFNSTGCVIENSESDHDQQGVYLDAWGNGVNTMTVRYNYIHDANAITSSYGIGTNLSAIGDVHNIYYNLVENCGHGATDYEPLMFPNTNGGAINFYNNTVYNNGAVVIKNQMFAVHGTNITLKNNIFYFHAVTDDYYTIYYVSSTGEPTSDYNQFYKETVWGYVYFNGTPYSTLAAWVAASSQDDNSQYGDPLFTTTGSDFSLQSGSPAINQGVDLGLTQDILGNPIVGLPDMGCYEKQ